MHLLNFHVSLPLLASEVMALRFSIRWYKRGEAQKRVTAFVVTTSLAGAFGGVLSYAISKLDGTAGLSSWRWVFIVGTPGFSLPVVVP